MKPLAYWMLISMVYLLPVKIFCFMFDSAIAEGMNWLGTHWEWVGQNYKGDKYSFVLVVVVGYLLWKIDRLHYEIEKKK